MEYQAYQMEFLGAVHFGKQNLEDGDCTCYADTLFSALCQEALQKGEETLAKLYQYVVEGELILSDAFPYMGETYYLPKPMKRIVTENTSQGDSILKKAYKKLKYIPMNAIALYLSGEYDVLHAPSTSELVYFEMKTLASIRGEKETVPYRVGTYYFYPGNGLYLIVGYERKETRELLEELLNGLSFSGIGGKRASGLGRFHWHSKKLPVEFGKRLEGTGTQYMSLSVSLPQREELEKALEGAEYILCKRSGFVASQTYAPEQRRKRDLYVLKAGSCFYHKYRGGIYDVSEKVGSHPVYRYAKPMFMEVDT